MTKESSEMLFPEQLGQKSGRATDASNKAADFVDALANMSALDNYKEEIPPIFPLFKNDVKDREAPVDPLAPKEKELSRDFTAKYARFDLSTDSDRMELESVMGHVMKDGWMLAREEWVHAKDGNTFVILKYLIRNTPIKPTLL